jgi:hypothetical protein
MSCFVLLCLFVLVALNFVSCSSKYLWFTAVGNGHETDYLMMVQAALESALQCCSNTIFPVVVIGGDPSIIPKWLIDIHRSKQVYVVNHNLTFSTRIKKFSKDPTIKDHGAFQRLDIPLLVDEIHGILQENSIDVRKDYVMYTDADVLLLNLNESNFIKPALIAYGAEDEKGLAANSGVLFMNVAAMKKEIFHLFDFADERLWAFPAIEQGLVLQYFQGKHQKLEDRYNWKPYWGVNSHAFVVHFHGAKVDRCVECFIKYMYTQDLHEVGTCTNPRGLCGAYSLWNAMARDRYKLTYKAQTQAYIQYVRLVYKYIYDFSVRLDVVETTAVSAATHSLNETSGRNDNNLAMSAFQQIGTTQNNNSRWSGYDNKAPPEKGNEIIRSKTGGFSPETTGTGSGDTATIDPEKDLIHKIYYTGHPQHPNELEDETPRSANLRGKVE